MQKFFQKLIKSHLIPADSTLLSPEEIKSKCIYVSDFKKITSQDEKLGCSRFVIADNADLVTLDSHGVHSVVMKDSDSLYRTSMGNRTICRFELSNSKGKLSKLPANLDTLIKTTANGSVLKEEIKMENGKSILDQLNQQVAGGAKPMNNFNTNNENLSDEEKKERAKAKRKETEAAMAALEGTISAATKDVGLAETAYLHSFNRKHGEVLFHVVDHDACVKYAVKTVFDLDAAGNRILGANATEEDKAKVAAGKNARKEAYQTHPVLELREAPVSKPLGTVIRMAKGGLVPESELRQAGKSVNFDKENKDTVILPLTIDATAHFIRAYFGGEIRESEKTHGAAAGTLRAKTVIKDFRKKGETTTTRKTVYSLVPSNRKKVIMKGNYVARKTYKTVPLSKINSGDEKLQADAAKSLFAGLFKSTKSYEAKYNILDENTKKLVVKDDKTGNITSAYMTGAQVMKVKSAFDPSTDLVDPQIPMKKFTISEKTGNESSKYIVYDVKNPAPETADLNPQTSGKYDTIIKELGNMTIEDVVNACIPTTARKKASAKGLELSNEDALKLEYAGITEGIPGIEYTGASKETLKAVNEMIASVIA